MKKINFLENELLNHNRLGLVRLFEQDGKYCLIKILNKDLKTWSIKKVQSKNLKKSIT